MTQQANPGASPNPQRKNQPQSQTGIINDLTPSQVAGQSMIVNDVFPQGGAKNGGQMIINDLPTQAEQQRIQRMILEGQKTAANLPTSQQIIVNDMPFVDTGRKGTDPDQRLHRVSVGQQPVVINAPQPPNKSRPPEANTVTVPQRPQNPAPAANVQREVANPAMTARPEVRTPAPAPAKPNVPQESKKPATTPQVEETSKKDKPARGKAKAAPKKPTDPDVWEGTYAGRTMTPSVIGCVLLSVLVVWGCIKFVPADLWLMTLGCLLGSIWGMQFIRWGYRVYCFHYRLNKENLRVSRGLLYGRAVEVSRVKIEKVTVSATLVQKILGVGKVIVEVKENTPKTLELDGVSNPRAVAARIQGK